MEYKLIILTHFSLKLPELAIFLFINASVSAVLIGKLNSKSVQFHCYECLYRQWQYNGTVEARFLVTREINQNATNNPLDVIIFPNITKFSKILKSRPVIMGIWATIHFKYFILKITLSTSTTLGKRRKAKYTFLLQLLQLLS